MPEQRVSDERIARYTSEAIGFSPAEAGRLALDIRDCRRERDTLAGQVEALREKSGYVLQWASDGRYHPPEMEAMRRAVLDTEASSTAFLAARDAKVRREALEEAAKACDAMAAHWKALCAGARIRALAAAPAPEESADGKDQPDS